ncbi:MAG TPA: enoyl-CoA hydratase-related protein, partial [Dehalococcoidia bacterium]|nr:enoyl-CoA hydratase-related protein [Dehalococcoidia bacterium]
PHDDLMKEVGELAKKIAAGPPIALEFAKYGVYRGLETDLQTALDYESYAQKVCMVTEDHKEGVRSFLEKRKAEFKGF